MLVGGVFIDLQKAFHTVDHKILLCKLNHYGKANEWFNSYLTNRISERVISKQTITCNWNASKN